MRVARGPVVIALITLLAGSPATAGRATTPGPHGGEKADTWSLTTAVALGPVGKHRQADLAITSDGARALSVGAGGLSQVDIASTPGVVVGRARRLTGSALALRPGRRYAYLADGTELKVVSIATARPRPVRSLSHATPTPITDLVVSPGGNWLYLSYGRGLVRPYGVEVFSLATPARPRLVARFATEPGPVRLALDRTGTMLAVGHRVVGSVTLVRVTEPRRPDVLGTRIPMPRKNSVSGLVFGHSGKRLYAVGSDEASVTMIGVRRREVLDTVDLSSVAGGGGAAGIAITGDGAWLYVSFAGQVTDNTVVAARSSDITVDVAVNNLISPRPLAVSPAGATQDTAYFTSGPSRVLARPAALSGLVRHPG